MLADRLARITVSPAGVIRTTCLRRSTDLAPPALGEWQVLGMLQVGQIVNVLEIKQDKKGKQKIRHEHGWTPMKAPDGRPVLELVEASLVYLDSRLLL